MSKIVVDVTDMVKFQLNDDEHLPLLKCICGQEYTAWECILSIYDEDPTICGTCQRKMYFSNQIRVYEIIE